MIVKLSVNENKSSTWNDAENGLEKRDHLNPFVSRRAVLPPCRDWAARVLIAENSSKAYERGGNEAHPSALHIVAFYCSFFGLISFVGSFQVAVWSSLRRCGLWFLGGKGLHKRALCDGMRDC